MYSQRMATNNFKLIHHIGENVVDYSISSKCPFKELLTLKIASKTSNRCSKTYGRFTLWSSKSRDEYRVEWPNLVESRKKC